MKKLAASILVLCLLFTTAFSAKADQDVFEFQRRIIFEYDPDIREYEFYVLTDEGTVFANEAGYKAHPEIREWKDLVSLRVNWGIAAGLKKDGTVCVAVSNPKSRNLIAEAAQWKDIAQIVVCYESIYGLTKDNRIIYAGNDYNPDKDQKAKLAKSNEWGRIARIVGSLDLIAITDDGHVFSTMPEDFSELDHIVDVITDGFETDFLKDDGTNIMYTEWERGIGTFDVPDIHDICQITYFDGTRMARLTNNHEYIVPMYSSLESFTDPSIQAISGFAWVDLEGVIHMDQKQFGLEGVELPRISMNP